MDVDEPWCDQAAGSVVGRGGITSALADLDDAVVDDSDVSLIARSSGSVDDRAATNDKVVSQVSPEKCVLERLVAPTPSEYYEDPVAREKRRVPVVNATSRRSPITRLANHPSTRPIVTAALRCQSARTAALRSERLRGEVGAPNTVHLIRCTDYGGIEG